MKLLSIFLLAGLSYGQTIDWSKPVHINGGSVIIQHDLTLQKYSQIIGVCIDLNHHTMFLSKKALADNPDLTLLNEVTFEGTGNIRSEDDFYSVAYIKKWIGWGEGHVSWACNGGDGLMMAWLNRWRDTVAFLRLRPTP